MSRSVRSARARRNLAGALVTAAALATASGLAPPSRTVAQATTPAPTVTITPSANVSDGQYLVVTFSGFGNQEAFDFRQCIASPAPVNIATDCTPLIAINGTAITAFADKKGRGSTYVPVYSGTDQFLENAGATGPITCDNAHPCVVAMMPDPNDLSTATLLTVDFAPSANLCPPPGANEVVGSGSATAYRAMYQWQASVCQPPTSLPVNYTLKSSPDGVLNFLTGTTQFGVTGPWAPDYTPVSTATPAQTWDYAPITMSGLVLAYRMYDLRGPQITTLKLTPAEIAAVFTGSLNNLATDPGVTALNPGIEFPGVLFTFVRAEHAAESWTFTSWLSKVAPSIWTYGPEEIFPAAASVIAKTGSAGVAFSVLTNPNENFSGQGTIGFMDSSTAAYYGLPTVAIANADGTTTAATTDTIARAVNEATLNTNGTVTPASTDETAWPMLIPTYMMVPTNNVTPATGTEIANFLRFAVQGGQSSTTLPPGYAPLTGSMVGASLLAASAIPVTPPPPPATTLQLPPATQHSTSFGGGTPLLPPLLPSTSATPAAHPSAVAAASTSTTPLPSAPPLALAGDTAPLLPITAGLAVLALLGGLGLEAVNQVSRRRSRSHPRGPRQP